MIGLFAVPRSLRFDHFRFDANSGNAGDDADPDGDGWSNALGFAAGTDPNVPASLRGIDSLAFTGDDVVIAFPTIAVPMAGTGGGVKVHDEDAAAEPRRFDRLVVLP